MARNLHLISESTGSLARHMVSVAVSQFPQFEFEIQEHPFCESIVQLREARSSIRLETKPLVFSALTQPRLRKSLATWCVKRKIEHWELVNPLVDFVAKQIGKRAIGNASKSHKCNDDYFRRIDAWEFTLQHDDSRRLESIGQSDIILLGVSRVGKTPLAAYLGSQGYRVSNVSLTRGAAVPPEVIANRTKAVGLTLDADRLAAVRKRRFELNRLGEAIRQATGRSHSYCSTKSAFDDIMFAEKQFRRLGVSTLDMTEMTVEESAARVLTLLALLP